MTCKPDASHSLLWHSFTTRSHPMIRVWTCPIWHAGNKCICQHFTFWWIFSFRKTLTFLFMTSYTRWGAICSCFTYLHPTGWHTDNVVNLWWKMRKLVIYLPDTLCPRKRLVTCLGEIWASRNKRSKEEKDQAVWLRLSLRVTEYPWFPIIKMTSNHNVGEPPVLVTGDILKLN